MPPLRVVIFESFHQGHRLQYVRAFAQSIADIAPGKLEIILATSTKAPTTREFATHIAPIAHHLRVDAFLDPPAESDKPLVSGRQRLQTLRQTIDRTNPDHLYIPYADGLAQYMGLTRLRGQSPRRKGMEIEAVLMRGKFAYDHRGLRASAHAAAWCSLTSLAPFNIVHALDPLPYEAIRKRGGSLARRTRLIPEPVESIPALPIEQARRQLNLPLDGRLIVCSGTITSRKGADRLIRSFAAANLLPSDRLLLMGRFDEAVVQAVNTAKHLVNLNRLIVRNETVSDADLYASLSAANLVCLPYPRHVGSSGIAVRAAAVGRRILTSDYGWLDFVTRRLGLGEVCDCTSDQPLTNLLPTALDRAANFKPTPEAERFVQFHTQSNFETCVSARLRERLGIPSKNSPLTWEWVVSGESTPRSNQPHAAR